MSVPTLPGITSQMTRTRRINSHVLFSGPEEGIPAVFVHGNFSSATYWEETMLALPAGYRAIAPDLRGYGDTEALPTDGARGARDWSDDLKALLDELAAGPAHLVGWSLGAAVLMQFTLDYPEFVRSLTFVSPVSPYGFGGTKDAAGAPCYDDFAGSGGGVVNPEFIRRIQEGDRSADDPNSPRNVINTFYYKAPFRAAREEEFLSAALLERIGEQYYPGDMTPSANWPNVAPGRWGPINATSPKYFNTSAIVNLAQKPPILWVRGDSDLIVSDNSMFDFGTLGKLGYVPGWPGDEVYPPQPMVSQMRAVLERYQANGGAYREVVIADAAHSPHIQKPAESNAAFHAFLQEVGG
ncbi:MAG: alpha/beta hydrolase [Chloroflexi bacterium]|nr:alpha/beta hydrolase [Chloroflexota bacterium]MCI0574735.1 alpha/beta hydrolase [Chloroflexota bacterium]MCI0646294.1 alpha/beta hydrolase [Chloroflexota bacterium]MCI0730308.1 alpha/beta hydrolase [Chloroflexota bacterium]